MRLFVPDEFKKKGAGWLRPTDKRQKRKREAVRVDQELTHKPGNSQWIKFPGGQPVRPG